jgi:hypothetical protein
VQRWRGANNTHLLLMTGRRLASHRHSCEEQRGYWWCGSRGLMGEQESALVLYRLHTGGSGTAPQVRGQALHNPRATWLICSEYDKRTKQPIAVIWLL